MKDVPVLSHCSLPRSPWLKSTGVLEHCREDYPFFRGVCFWPHLLRRRRMPLYTSLVTVLPHSEISVNNTREFRELSAATTYSLTSCVCKPWRQMEWLHYATTVLEGSEWRASCPDHLTRIEIVPSSNWIGDWLCPDMGRFRAEHIWCPCWESRFPNHPLRSLFSSPTDAVLHLPLGTVYLNSSISPYTTNFNAAVCSVRSLTPIVRLWQACGRPECNIHVKYCLQMIRFSLQKLCFVGFDSSYRMKKCAINFQYLLKCFHTLNVSSFCDILAVYPH